MFVRQHIILIFFRMLLTITLTLKRHGFFLIITSPKVPNKKGPIFKVFFYHHRVRNQLLFFNVDEFSKIQDGRQTLYSAATGNPLQKSN
jgi:hypothetical protein